GAGLLAPCTFLTPHGPNSRSVLIGNPDLSHPREENMADTEAAKRAAYWKANVKLMLVLLSIWFLVSYVFGILLVDQLNAIRIGGYKLGFWFAQQGSMYTFVVLVFVYSRRMAVLDRKFDVEE